MSETVAAVSGARAPALASLGIDPGRPLFLIDVDEVLGLFMQAFGRFVESRGVELRVERYALLQNLYRPLSGEAVAVEEGRELLADFFRLGSGEMEPAPGAVEALRRLSQRAGVVILTNAPGHGRLARARWLGRHRLDYPLVLNSGPKGPLAAGLAAQSAGPVAFVDDLISNLDSVALAAPGVARFQMVADARLRPLAPSAPDKHRRVDDWAELEAELAALAG